MCQSFHDLPTEATRQFFIFIHKLCLYCGIARLYIINLLRYDTILKRAVHPQHLTFSEPSYHVLSTSSKKKNYAHAIVYTCAEPLVLRSAWKLPVVPPATPKYTATKQCEQVQRIAAKCLSQEHNESMQKI